MVTLYETLGVREDATADEIKRAYRRAAMRSHPDRHAGREAQAHAAFHEVKEAYAILSDPEQRRVYDSVFAEEMRRLARQREQTLQQEEREQKQKQQEQEQEQAQKQGREHERRATARHEEDYAALATLALRFVERGYNRDVVFGVLLGRDCEAALAARIADSACALHAARQADAQRKQASATAAASGRGRRSRAMGEREPASGVHASGSKPDAPGAGKRADEADAKSEASQLHGGFFSTLWHGLFGVRSSDGN